MKISAANQSLILANEGPTGRPAGSQSQSSRSTSSGGNSAAGLQRLTVVAELPDSTVVTVHADYAARAGAATSATVNSDDRVVSSQTPSRYGSDSAIGSVFAASSGNRTAALAAGASSPQAAPTAGTNPAAGTTASPPSLVQLSSPAYSRLLRDSDDSRDSAGNPYSHNGNVALYARTERMSGATLYASRVDVHA